MYEYIFDDHLWSFVRVDQRDKMLRDSVAKVINNKLKWKWTVWSTRIWLTRKIYEFPFDTSENNDYRILFLIIDFLKRKCT